MTTAENIMCVANNKYPVVKKRPSFCIMPSKTIIMVTDPEVFMKGIGKKINRELINKTKPETNLLCNWDK